MIMMMYRPCRPRCRFLKNAKTVLDQHGMVANCACACTTGSRTNGPPVLGGPFRKSESLAGWPDGLTKAKQTSSPLASSIVTIIDHHSDNNENSSTHHRMKDDDANDDGIRITMMRNDANDDGIRITVIMMRMTMK